MENILDAYQLHIGLKNDILAKPEECKYSNSCWIKELTTGMATFHMKIYRQNGIKLTPQRQNEQQQCFAERYGTNSPAWFGRKYSRNL